MTLTNVLVKLLKVGLLNGGGSHYHFNINTCIFRAVEVVFNG